MEKAKVEEYAELKQESSNYVLLVLPSAFVLLAVLASISALTGQMDHNWWSYLLGVFGALSLIIMIREKIKQKKRLKVLQAELDKEEIKWKKAIRC